MQAIRITAVVCVTALVVLVGVLVYLNHQDRYLVLPQDKAMFVFDRTNGLVNYCTTDQCQLVMPNGYADQSNMAINAMSSGQVFYQPAAGGMFPGFGGMGIGMGGGMNGFPFMQPFKSSLQTRPAGYPAMAPAGMFGGGQMVMVPSPIMPTAMKSGKDSKEDDKKHKEEKKLDSAPAANTNAQSSGNNTNQNSGAQGNTNNAQGANNNNQAAAAQPQSGGDSNQNQAQAQGGGNNNNAQQGGGDAQGAAQPGNAERF